MFICWGRDVYFRVELLGHELVNHLGSNLMMLIRTAFNLRTWVDLRRIRMVGLKYVSIKAKKKGFWVEERKRGEQNMFH